MTDEVKPGYVAVPVELIEDIHYHISCYDTTTSKTNAGYHLGQLNDKVHDLATWHPRFDNEHGTLPWQREDEV